MAFSVGNNDQQTDSSQPFQRQRWDFDKEYQSHLPTYKRALDDLEQKLTRLIEDMERDGLFRARVAKARVKEPKKIRDKCERDDISLNRAFDVLTDIIGARIVCNNLQDIEKVIDAIRKHPDVTVVNVDPPEKVHAGTNRGYRGRHMVVKTVAYQGYERREVVAEVQVRTLLQDAWAHLSHDDFYKPEEENLHWLNEQMKELSDRLYALDKTAQDIRDAVQKHYAGLRRSLGSTVSNRLGNSDTLGAVTAILESLSSQDPGLQLAAIEVFVDNPTLWDIGMEEFGENIAKMSEWIKERVIDRLTRLNSPQLESFTPLIEKLVGP